MLRKILAVVCLFVTGTCKARRTALWKGHLGITSSGPSDGSEVKASACNAGDLGLIHGWRRSPGEGNGNPLQYSCLGNPMDRGAWQATVPGVTKAQTWLSDKRFTFTGFWRIVLLRCQLHYSICKSLVKNSSMYYPPLKEVIRQWWEGPQGPF